MSLWMYYWNITSAVTRKKRYWHPKSYTGKTYSG